jgi:YggT family protein
VFDHSSFLAGVIGLIDNLLLLYLIVVTARVIISWVNPDPYNRIVQILCSLTDPALNGLRRWVPSFFWSTGLDFTPLILILLIQVARLFLGNLHP